MKKTLITALLWLLIPSAYLSAQPLAGTDELGRTLPQNDETGDPKSDRQVGMFYFLWSGDEHSLVSDHYWDLTKIVAEHPEVLEDKDNKWWGSTEFARFYFWGEPIYGYYRSDDYWVHLRSMQLLTDAGVDFVVIDATNAFVYEKQADVLMRAMDAVRKQGKNPPRIVFYTNTQSGDRIQQAYEAFYKPGAPYYHPECWYYLDGKPLIIGVTAQTKGREYETFFTYRESQWPNEPDKVNGWPWISFTRPQKVYSNASGEREIISVSVSQHPDWEAGMGGSAFYGNTKNWGRCYHNGQPGDPSKEIVYGYNFQEQWDYALKQDVPFVFVTGWNEWVAGRWSSTDDNPEHSWFCDQASPEYSRDLEPTLTAGMKDNYYMQLVANVRRYKGVEAVSDPGPEKKIRGMEDWDEVSASYRDYIDDTDPRNHPAAFTVPAVTYTNNTGRNDFELMKVARDRRNLYFYVQTVDPIQLEEADNCMTLWIDVDRDSKTGWYGYDYRVNYGSELQRYENGMWKTITEVASETEGNKMSVTIPRNVLQGISADPDIEFKWSDNMQQADPMDWYVNGDAAPGGRFNYIYTTK
ncbi:MAG TPA: hypothetical protein IAA13_01235 [Candidatus Alistipes merdigallinarum]|nr:hypothetical protein [Candidatus Alistipes merdigallinarum]